MHYADPTGRGPEVLPVMIYYAGVGLVAFTAWYYAYIQQHPIRLALDEGRATVGDQCDWFKLLVGGVSGARSQWLR